MPAARGKQVAGAGCLAPGLQRPRRDDHPHRSSGMLEPARARRLTRAGLGALLLLLGSGCAALRRPDPPIDRSEDPRIRREIEARLAAEPAIEAARIRVEVDGRIVVLHGSVRGVQAWQCAIRNAQLVQGVQSVSDFLAIERGPAEIQCLARRDPG
jgi:hypothetical protein